MCKKNKIAFVAGAFLLALCVFVAGSYFASGSHEKSSGGMEDEGGITVVTSFYPMYDFASKIGGDKVHVVNLVPAGAEPHAWEPSPSDMATLEQADVFVYNGAGMETWADDVLENIDTDNLIVCEASRGISLRANHHHDHDDSHHDHDHGDAHHDHHGAYDPHVWLYPMHAGAEMKNIHDCLCAADPDNASYYDEMYEKWSAEIRDLDQEYKSDLERVPRKDIVVTHEAFGYLCDAYGLNQMPIHGISPDQEPDAAHVAEIQQFVAEHAISTVFTETLVSPKVAEAIARDAGARVDVLNPLGGLTAEQIDAGEEYFSIMRSNLESLVKALGE